MSTAPGRLSLSRRLDGCPTTLPSDTDREGPARWLAQHGAST
jgi:hypothetical protein